MSNVDSKTVNITIPKALLKQVDALAKRDYTSRSDIIRQALLTRIRAPKAQLDEWGDPIDGWQEVMDFRKHGYPSGMPGDEYLKLLQDINGQDKKNARKTTT